MNWLKPTCFEKFQKIKYSVLNFEIFSINPTLLYASIKRIGAKFASTVNRIRILSKPTNAASIIRGHVTSFSP